VGNGIVTFSHLLGLKTIGDHKMSNVKLSIVIVGYKSWDVIDSCLTSFKMHTPKTVYEIIVVNNYPQDSRFDSFAKKHPEAKFINNKGNYGFSNGCNLGAKHSIGKYLLFLNPDTELTSDDAIDAMIGLLSNDNSVGLTSCRTTKPSGKIEREMLFSSPWLLISFVRQIYKLLFRARLQEKFEHSAEIWYPEWVSGSVIMVSRSLFDKIGGWNQARFWMYHEDPDICNRVRKLDKKIAIIRNKSIRHIGGGTSRKNNKTTIMAKTEVIISSHNYIQINTTSVGRTLLHFLFSTTSIITLLIKSVISLLILHISKSNVYFFTVISIFKYYFFAVRKKTWKSQKILNYEKN
jgi:GT2 family glycosyltransferase